LKSAFHRKPKIFTAKNFAKKKKNRFSFISMSKMAVTKTKNFMKLRPYLAVVLLFAMIGLSTFAHGYCVDRKTPDRPNTGFCTYEGSYMCLPGGYTCDGDGNFLTY
jgi:hypothetical protein